MAIAASLLAGTASAGVPLFAAKCGPDLNVDTNTQGQVYMNGKVAKVIKRPDGQISANSHGMWVDITPQGDQPPRITYTAKDKTVGNCEILSFKAPGGAQAGSPHSSALAHDAKVPGTNYHATTNIPCSMGGGAPTTSCFAGVERRGGGSGMVTVTKPDGRTRTIYFEKGRATGYDQSQADPGKFSASRQGDTTIVHIGQERYEIFDAMLFGG
ncbi:MAG: hypothetical protein MUF63_07345 [Rhodobacteraceae bacterium]|nr:hypothetical protein [Paracoccaceae bacterium]